MQELVAGVAPGRLGERLGRALEQEWLTDELQPRRQEMEPERARIGRGSCSTLRGLGNKAGM